MKIFILFLLSSWILIFPQNNEVSYSFSTDDIIKTIGILGNDSLRGRGTGTKGEEIAAEYISRELKGKSWLYSMLQLDFLFYSDWKNFFITFY